MSQHNRPADEKDSDRLLPASSGLCEFSYDCQQISLHFLGDRLEPFSGKHRQQGGRFDRRDLGFTAFLIDRDAAGQGGRDRHIPFENYSGLLRIAHLEDEAFSVEWDALVVHFLSQVVRAEHSELMARCDFGNASAIC